MTAVPRPPATLSNISGNTSADTLADHLIRTAGQTPDALALSTGTQDFTWSDWLQETRHAAQQLPVASSPLVTMGDSLHLARLAFACALQNRTFWPVDRHRSPSLSQQPPPGTALIISTSGSEGHPRPICLGNTQLDHAAAAANRHLDLHAGDCWLHCLPLFHIGGQAILWRCARAGASILLHDGFSAGRLADAFARHPVSHISLVPTMLASLLEAGVTPPASLRVALIGGAALTPALHARAQAAGWPLHPSYGMSETTAQIATWRPQDGPWQPGLVGRPMPGHQIGIDSRGRIRLRGPQIMTATAAGHDQQCDGPDNTGWLTTGDLGKIDAAGRLTVLGRADDMLISGGVNVHPQEVEACLAALPGVRDVAVAGRPDERWGDRIVALVVGELPDEHTLKKAMATLRPAARPREFHRLASLPRNPAGKLDRPALRRLIADLPR